MDLRKWMRLFVLFGFASLFDLELKTSARLSPPGSLGRRQIRLKLRPVGMPQWDKSDVVESATFRSERRPISAERRKGWQHRRSGYLIHTRLFQTSRTPEGVPMVAIPIAYDQPGVAARVAYHGVGEFSR